MCNECILHYGIIQGIFTALNILFPCIIHSKHHPTPNSWQPLTFFAISTVLPFQECHISIGRILQCVAFSDWLLSFSNMHLSFLYISSWFDSSFLFRLINIPVSGCTTLYLSIHLLKDILAASKSGQL